MSKKFIPPPKPEIIFNPNFKHPGFEENTKVYVIDKDGNKRELPDKYWYIIPKKEKNK